MFICRCMMVLILIWWLYPTTISALSWSDITQSATDSALQKKEELSSWGGNSVSKWRNRAKGLVTTTLRDTELPVISKKLDEINKMLQNDMCHGPYVAICQNIQQRATQNTQVISELTMQVAQAKASQNADDISRVNDRMEKVDTQLTELKKEVRQFTKILKSIKKREIAIASLAKGYRKQTQKINSPEIQNNSSITKRVSTLVHHIRTQRSQLGEYRTSLKKAKADLTTMKPNYEMIQAHVADLKTLLKRLRVNYASKIEQPSKHLSRKAGIMGTMQNLVTDSEAGARNFGEDTKASWGKSWSEFGESASFMKNNLFSKGLRMSDLQNVSKRIHDQERTIRLNLHGNESMFGVIRDGINQIKSRIDMLRQEIEGRGGVAAVNKDKDTVNDINQRIKDIRTAALEQDKKLETFMKMVKKIRKRAGKIRRLQNDLVSQYEYVKKELQADPSVRENADKIMQEIRKQTAELVEYRHQLKEDQARLSSDSPDLKVIENGLTTMKKQLKALRVANEALVVKPSKHIRKKAGMFDSASMWFSNAKSSFNDKLSGRKSYESVPHEYQGQEITAASFGDENDPLFSSKLKVVEADPSESAFENLAEDENLTLWDRMKKQGTSWKDRFSKKKEEPAEEITPEVVAPPPKPKPRQKSKTKMYILIALGIIVGLGIIAWIITRDSANKQPKKSKRKRRKRKKTKIKYAEDDSGFDDGSAVTFTDINRDAIRLNRQQFNLWTLWVNGTCVMNNCQLKFTRGGTIKITGDPQKPNHPSKLKIQVPQAQVKQIFQQLQ